MDLIYIAIYWLIDGVPTQLEGWMPLVQGSMEECQVNLASAMNMVKDNQFADAFGASDYQIFCGTEPEIAEGVANRW